jgi:hypothetical protein
MYAGGVQVMAIALSTHDFNYDMTSRSALTHMWWRGCDVWHHEDE